MQSLVYRSRFIWWPMFYFYLRFYNDRSWRYRKLILVQRSPFALLFSLFTDYLCLCKIYPTEICRFIVLDCGFSFFYWILLFLFYWVRGNACVLKVLVNGFLSSNNYSKPVLFFWTAWELTTFSWAPAFFNSSKYRLLSTRCYLSSIYFCL